MKKNWWRKAVGLGLTLAMVVSLSACGGEKNENNALAKEGVYKFQEISLPKMDADYLFIDTMAYRDGKVQMVIQTEKYSEGTSESNVHLVSMNKDGSDVSMVKVELPDQNNGSSGGGAVPMPRSAVTESEPGEAEDEESGEGETGDGEDPGEGETGDGEDPGEGETGDGEESADREDIGETDPGFGTDDIGSDTWEYTNYFNFVIASDGGLYGLKQYQFEQYGEEYYNIQKYYACRWDSQGKLIQETELQIKDPDKEDEWVNINVMNVAPDGTMYLVLSGDNSYGIQVDPQGNASGRKELPEEVGKVFMNYNNLIAREDGTFLCIYYDENDWTKQFIVSYDPAEGKLGQATPLPSTFVTRGFSSMRAGIGTDLIMNDSSGVYTYNVGDEDAVQKMNFINSDFDNNYFEGMVELDENTFIAIYNDRFKDDVNAGIFTYVKPEDIPDKSVLVVGGDYIPWDIKKRVVEFNRNSEEYRLVLREYNTFNTYEDWTAGATQLNNDITTGKMPDILIGSELPMENYAVKGLLEDIGKLIEEDEELSKVEFVENVFEAYSVDGTLYYVIPSFSVQTMAGKTSVVGDRTEWTMQEAEQLLSTMPEGTSLFGEMTRDSYFSTAMSYCAGDFVDVATGKCDFSSQRFIDMMEYAKSLPETQENEEYAKSSYSSGNWQTQYRENRTILMQLYINTIRDLNYNVNGRFGEDVSYVGFPMEGGQGACVSAGNMYAISSKSNYKEGAWEFLRYYLTEEYQAENASWTLSIHKKIFMDNAQLATERPFWEDPETGEKEYYDDTIYMNGESIVIPPMSQAQVDKVVNYIFSVKKSRYYNNNVMNIINEEMGGFFSGQKSAQEVANIIQNRVQLYVDENR